MALNLPAIQEALILLLIMITSLTLHEWGHAWTADRLGDDTPRLNGRVTLNPLSHIDPIGTVLLPLMGSLGFFGTLGLIGWAKPVPINPGNYRRRNWDQAWVTIAGPAMNLILAFVAVFAAAMLARMDPKEGTLLYDCWDAARLLLQVNVALIVFNLLPIPPLDGSKFLMYWFGMGEEAYYSFARWGWIVLLVAVNLPPFQILLGTLMRIAMSPFAWTYTRLLA